MRKHLMVGLGLCGLAACWVGATALADRGAWEPASEGSDENAEALMSPAYSGTFLVTLTDTEGNQVLALSTFHQDRTLTVADTTDFGSNFPNAHLDSPSHGAWRVIGTQQTSSSILHFSYEDDGTLMFTTRSDFVSDFTPGGDSFSGQGSSRIYFPGQDPLDPEGGIVINVFSYTGQRLNPQ